LSPKLKPTFSITKHRAIGAIDQCEVVAHKPFSFRKLSFRHFDQVRQDFFSATDHVVVGGKPKELLCDPVKRQIRRWRRDVPGEEEKLPERIRATCRRYGAQLAGLIAEIGHDCMRVPYGQIAMVKGP
jgi:hypothetical protein